MGNQIALWRTRLDTDQPNLKRLDLDNDDQNLDMLTTRLPGGAYTTLRTYQGNRTLSVQDQAARLEQSASLAGEPLKVEPGRLRAALRDAVEQSQHEFTIANISCTNQDPKEFDVRLRLILDLETQVGDIYIAAEPLEVLPPSAYRQGVTVITSNLQRLLPEAKLTRFIIRSRSLRQRLPEGVNEAIMVNERGELLEGLTSNFFGVLEDKIYSAQQGVLAGVTRRLVLESAQRLELPVNLRAVRLAELPFLEEAFITSSSRGTLPVCRIDAIPVNNGKPGALTLRLKQVYEALIFEQLEPLA